MEMLGNLGVNFEGFGIYSCQYSERQHLLLQIITPIMIEVHLQNHLEMILQENHRLFLENVADGKWPSLSTVISMTTFYFICSGFRLFKKIYSACKDP